MADLIPYARNARTHTDAQVAQVAASIREFGWTNPVLVDGANGIIAGHARTMAAAKLGMTEVPVIELAGLTEAQRRAYILADNKMSLNAGWDDELLAVELTDLVAADFDMELTGFSADELAALIDGDGATEGEDDVPEPPADPITQPGDLWTMGAHRLLCGDSTVAEDVDRLMDGARPLLMVTDPPYGVEYDASWRNDALLADGTPIGERAVGPVKNDDRADWSAAWALFPGDVAYVWHHAKHIGSTERELIACKLEPRVLIVWAKNNATIGRGHYHSQFETVWYAVRKGGKGHWVGGRKQSTVWNIDKPMKSETGHSTQKPVECMRRPIVNNSNQGQVVYDPFIGSGTTIIAAETTGRACYGIEIEPAYVDIAVKRWEDFTNGTAKKTDSNEKSAGKPRRKKAADQ